MPEKLRHCPRLRHSHCAQVTCVNGTRKLISWWQGGCRALVSIQVPADRPGEFQQERLMLRSARSGPYGPDGIGPRRRRRGTAHESYRVDVMLRSIAIRTCALLLRTPCSCKQRFQPSVRYWQLAQRPVTANRWGLMAKPYLARALPIRSRNMSSGTSVIEPHFSQTRCP